jgi:LysR family hca operon transcriptional activator
MDLRYLRYFIAVAEELSFTRAAQTVHTAQPSLSQQIRKLEDEIVQTPLFRRDKHHVELTEAGRVFLPEAKRILAAVERGISLARYAALSAAGRLVIGFMPGTEGAILAKVLPALHKLRPETHVLLRDLYSPDQILALRNKEIDAGFVRGPCEGPDLCWELVLVDPVVAVIPAKHPLAKLERIPVSRLAELPLIGIPRDAAAIMRGLTARIAAQSGVSFQPGPETDGITSTLAAVGAGLGFSFLPGYAERIKPLDVEVRPLEMDNPPEIELYVAYRKDDSHPGLQAFLALLRQLVCAPQASRGSQGTSAELAPREKPTGAARRGSANRLGRRRQARRPSHS